MNIPYGCQSISRDDISEVVKVLESDIITTGPKIAEFEEALCNYIGVKYCVVVSSGTAALHLASNTLLNAGDLVLTTPNSFLATSNAILYANARPIFVDIAANGNIDLDLCEKELIKNPSIKAIYVVHFSGNIVDQDKLAYLRDKYEVRILEDCSHSIGAVYQSKDGTVKAASCKNSDVSILSFHPVKHITTGEGGAITTNDKDIYDKVKQLRNHGMTRNAEKFQLTTYAYDSKKRVNPWYYEMNMLGFNYRITDLQCALGISQLKKLDGFLARRREIAKKYDDSFREHPLINPLYPFSGDSAYHLYVINIQFDKLAMERSDLFFKLYEKEIRPQVHYIPINKQPFYQQLGYGSEVTPVMDNYYATCLSLPIYYGLKSEQQTYVIETLLGCLKKRKK
jgi:UDP-4-amino-4,6-dideoxy-L-N-acetyl-beta-L-altrosamine transaminase